MTDLAKPAPADSKRNWKSRLATLAVLAITPFALVSVILHLTVQDQWSPLAPVFYALPLSVICIFGVWAAYLWFRRKRPRWGFAYALLACCCGVGFHMTSWCPTVARAEKIRGDFQLLTWNGWNGNLGVERLAQGVAKHAPDIATIVESGTGAEQIELWGQHLPGYKVVPFGREVLVLTKGSVRQPRQIRLGHKSVLSTCIVHLDQGSVQLAVADLVSNPLQSRRPVFERLREELDALSRDIPVILLGDFNTPRRSAYFDLLPKNLRNSWEVSGGGFGNTWPAVFPLWDLDQIWIDPQRLQLHDTRSHWTSRSDHLPIVASISFLP